MNRWLEADNCRVDGAELTQLSCGRISWFQICDKIQLWKLNQLRVWARLTTTLWLELCTVFWALSQTIFWKIIWLRGSSELFSGRSSERFSEDRSVRHCRCEVLPPDSALRESFRNRAKVEDNFLSSLSAVRYYWLSSNNLLNQIDLRAAGSDRPARSVRLQNAVRNKFFSNGPYRHQRPIADRS